ncbi:hypothetical protein FQA39_LY00630 [Lamprigera yunnana]|nr:hypothetical protein FQA39_LY00630 [Lamprigera yunnana]
MMAEDIARLCEISDGKFSDLCEDDNDKNYVPSENDEKLDVDVLTRGRVPIETEVEVVVSALFISYPVQEIQHDPIVTPTVLPRIKTSDTVNLEISAGCEKSEPDNSDDISECNKISEGSELSLAIRNLQAEFAKTEKLLETDDDGNLNIITAEIVQVVEVQSRPFGHNISIEDNKDKLNAQKETSDEWVGSSGRNTD